MLPNAELKKTSKGFFCFSNSEAVLVAVIVVVAVVVVIDVAVAIVVVVVKMDNCVSFHAKLSTIEAAAALLPLSRHLKPSFFSSRDNSMKKLGLVKCFVITNTSS